MSMNDNSPPRRGRREPEWPTPGRAPRDERRDQSSLRDRQAGSPYQDQQQGAAQQRAAYSGYTRPSYGARQEPAAPPPPPAQNRPPENPQGYYQQPAPRQENPHLYPSSPVASYVPPPQPYDAEPPHLGYGDGARDDLFGRDQAPLGYDQGYHSEAAYPAEHYNASAGRQPLAQPASARREEPGFYQPDPAPPHPDDYQRGFGARFAAQESPSRFFLPEDGPVHSAQPDRGYAPQMPPAAAGQGYAPSQQYHQPTFDPHAPAENYGHGYDPHYAGQEEWAGDGHGHALPQHAGHGEDVDEDFFADEDDFENDHHLGEPRRGRKKLLTLTLIAAIFAGGGGVYLYKMFKGGSEDKATPFIRADNRPSKEMPGNPGGRQFPNGEKAIYDRLTPDGQQTQVAFNQAGAGPSASQPSMGNSLEDRIEEALKKAQKSGDAPPATAPSGRPGTDQPTVVRSESYRPDGTRVDTARPMITPTITDVSNGQLPPPFGNALPVPSAQAAPPAPFRTTSAPAAPVAQPFTTASAPAPRAAPTRIATAAAVEHTPPAAGFYVSLKSAPDEKAIERDIPSLSGKYKSVLGDVQLTVKIADLGTRGVTYRAVAGPLGTRQEAMELCQKIKGVGGDKACFVTN